MMLTATELHMREPVPLHRVHEAIFAFCRGRRDVIVSGAQAVNLYTGEPRMSQDVDLIASQPAELAAELAKALHTRLRLAARIREVRPGAAYRIFQRRKSGGRHLADVRLADIPLDPAVERDGIRYVPLDVLAALKVCALMRRRQTPKGATDLADLRRLLISHPDLRTSDVVPRVLERLGAGRTALSAWEELLATPLVSDEDADEGY